MPQPYKKDDAVWGVASIEQRPHLAMHLGIVAAMWSAVEVQMGHVLAAIMHADAEIGSMLFGAIKAEAGRLAMIDVIAAERLSAEQYAKFQDLRKKVKSVGDQRDTLVHNPIGFAPSRPKTIMVFDARLWGKYYAAFTAAAHKGEGDSFDIARQRVGVAEYTESDLTQIQDQIHKLYLELHEFAQALSPINLGQPTRPNGEQA